MAHIGRTVKNVEAPRPLKSQSRQSLKNNYMLIEELIQLIENVALTLQSGINNTEPMASLVQNLRIHGPQLETVSKDTLDRAFVVFRNASQDERLNIMTRLNLLELIELRAKGWADNGFNSYYKTKQATNVEMPDAHHHHHQHPHHHADATQAAFLSTSPTFGAGSAAMAAAVAAVGSAQQQQLMLGPGELIRNSGKFPKPTKIPGKTYCKDEVVIRNADSGKVMGIKGRRVHMIEELSETIISFQKVNPGAKERLVQITGPTEEKINYAKQLIEDTIRRNASPVRLDPAMGAHTGGSCSSLASSNSDEATPRPGAGGISNLANRLSLNSAQNFMTATAAAQQVAVQQQQQAVVTALMTSSSTPNAVNAAAAVAAGKVMRPNQQMLLHSFSTNDASLGEYKYTVNVGQHLIKITGDCCDLVRVAKLVLDDYFSSAEFLASVEAGAAFDGSIVSPISTPSTPMGPPQFMMGTPLQMAPPLADSGIGLNYMAGQITNNTNDGDDDVFVDANGLASSQNNGLARSRRSHFSRKDSSPEVTTPNAAARNKSESGNVTGNINTDSTRIVHEYEHLLYYAKSPHSWALPAEWQKICEKFPTIIRNKVTHASTTNATSIYRIATTTSSSTTTTNTSNNYINNNNISNSSTTTPTVTTTVTPSATTNGSLCHLLDAKLSTTMQLNIKRKGFFNRQTYSIDEEACTADLLHPQGQQQPDLSIQAQLLNNEVISVSSAAASVYSAAVVTLSSQYANNNIYNTTTASSKLNNSCIQKNLLDKQFKFISAIMENSGKKLEQTETALQSQVPIIIEDSDDETDEIKIVDTKNIAPKDSVVVDYADAIEINNSAENYVPKFQREYRSHSTCN